MMKIVTCDVSYLLPWLSLRQALWPTHSEASHLQEMHALLQQQDRLQLLALNVQGQAIAMLEASIRKEYINGTRTTPVAFLEGIFVLVSERRQGIARALVNAAEQWASSQQCQEFASDASIDNEESYAMHQALGFIETERVVFFNKKISE